MIMKRLHKLLIFLLIFLSLLSLSAEAKQHIFWGINSDSATVYLLGSIHVGEKSLYPMDKVIRDAFDKSDFLVVEVDMNKVNPFELMKRAYLKDGDSLKNYISPEVYNKLKTEFDKLNIRQSFYSKMKPWFAVLTLMNMKMTKEGFDAASGIDMHFMNKASENNKEVLELETADFQISLLDSILGNMQDDFVLYSMQDIDSTKSQVDEMYNAWKKGDVKALVEIAFAEYDDMPNAEDFKKAFIYDRNVGMAKKIEQFLKTGKTYFVVVGAAHLIGDKGILKLLENENKYVIVQY